MEWDIHVVVITESYYYILIDSGVSSLDDDAHTDWCMLTQNTCLILVPV